MKENRDLEVNCSSTYKMLMGMSFELIFKAHYVGQCVGENIEINYSHNLATLAKKAEFPISNEEKEIFSVLTEYIYWDGKYPIPKKKDLLKNHWNNESKVTNDEKMFGDSDLKFLVSNNKLDHENLSLIWRKYSDIFMDKYN